MIGSTIIIAVIEITLIIHIFLNELNPKMYPNKSKTPERDIIKNIFIKIPAKFELFTEFNFAPEISA